MIDKQQPEFTVSSSILQRSNSPVGELTLDLHVDQLGPVFAEFVKVTFFIPAKLARHQKLPITDYINMNGVDYFMIRANDTIPDEVIDGFQSGEVTSYGFITTWDLPRDFRMEELTSDDIIYYKLLACVDPMHEFGKTNIEKTDHGNHTLSFF